MTIGHMEEVRDFRPRPGIGGSKKGKPQGPWPLFLLIAGDAVWMRYKGTIDACLRDRRFIPIKAFEEQLNILLPGLEDWMDEKAAGRRTNPYKLLHNRVYKMYYSGTSDRGRAHDPHTRAAMSREHWRHKVSASDPLVSLHDNAVRGRVARIYDWRTRL